ncbi:hypothetical protein BWQ96_00158 [Gracilariopsis chorda]|uniref:Uncharacterized protein n=1 Tax=Gracilariopsis chorda TaxID=448386 RepID=A0A2V3J6E5_9FLOR|nr:hypothetical protein BWQ96_00158 [Gracilariopsis chorda]|eukprot:PXF49998.1 hypothetical protein BWQ96_00158 [Gracilariopsis chorda]
MEKGKKNRRMGTSGLAFTSAPEPPLQSVHKFHTLVARPIDGKSQVDFSKGIKAYFTE